MRLYLLRTEPVEEIAAEPATLERLATTLHTRPRATSPGLINTYRAGQRWPLIPDETIRPGFVHFRPTPPRAHARLRSRTR